MDCLQACGRLLRVASPPASGAGRGNQAHPRDAAASGRPPNKLDLIALHACGRRKGRCRAQPDSGAALRAAGPGVVHPDAWRLSMGFRPCEIIPGHMASPARYTFQRHMEIFLPRYVGEDVRRVVDFGCGSAVFRFYFRGKSYVGFDLHQQDYASKAGPGVALLVADGECVPFRDACFDFVFCSAALEHIPDDVAAAGEAFRILKEGRYCFVIVPSALSPLYDEVPYWLLGRPGHGDHYYSELGISNLLADAGFDVVEVVPSMACFSSILRAFYIYARGLNALWVRAWSRVTKAPRRPVSLYGDSMAWAARDYEELLAVQARERRLDRGLKRLYRWLLEGCFFLDGALPALSRLACEWLVIVRKPVSAAATVAPAGREAHEPDAAAGRTLPGLAALAWIPPTTVAMF